jgi:acyl-CoA thioesterase FadM
VLTRERTVFVGDDDASGLIFFAMYFHYMAEGDQELFESIGHPIWGQIADGTAGPAVNATCDYLAPARAGDRLLQTIRLVAGSRSSVRTEHEWTLPSGTVAARGRITRAWVDLATMETVPAPAWIVQHADGNIE